MKGRTFVAGILAIVIGLGVIGYVGVPGVSKYVTSSRAAGCPGSSTGWEASSTCRRSSCDRSRTDCGRAARSPNHPIANLFDSRSNTDWRADGGTPSVTVTFPEKVDLLSLYVYSGIAGDDFVNLRRPATLQFTFPDGSSQTVTLQDVHDKQFFELKANGVSAVTITVPSTTGPDDAPVAISEIEFFKKGDGVDAAGLEPGRLNRPDAEPSGVPERRRCGPADAQALEDRRVLAPVSRVAAPVSPARSRASMSIRHKESLVVIDLEA